MQQNPKCPYCGKEMNLGYDGKGMVFGRCYFFCDCGAQAPSACVEYATPDDWIGIEGAAYLKATARPLRKPALEEMKIVLQESLHFKPGDEYCKVEVDIEKTAENLIANGVMMEGVQQNERSKKAPAD